MNSIDSGTLSVALSLAAVAVIAFFYVTDAKKAWEKISVRRRFQGRQPETEIPEEEWSKPAEPSPEDSEEWESLVINIADFEHPKKSIYAEFHSRRPMYNLDGMMLFLSKHDIPARVGQAAGPLLSNAGQALQVRKQDVNRAKEILKQFNDEDFQS